MSEHIKIIGKIDLSTGDTTWYDPTLQTVDPVKDDGPTDHTGTCSSCGGHTHYGYCQWCDTDLF